MTAAAEDRTTASEPTEDGSAGQEDFATEIVVARPPAEVFDAVVDVRRWWTGEIDGDATAVGAEFTYRFPGHHRSRQRVAELVPGERVVWHVVDSHLEHLDDPGEWDGTSVVFELTPAEGGTRVRFTHRGLVPDIECYDRCSGAWGFYVHESLRRLLTDGEGPTTPPWA